MIEQRVRFKIQKKLPSAKTDNRSMAEFELFLKFSEYNNQYRIVVRKANHTIKIVPYCHKLAIITTYFTLVNSFLAKKGYYCFLFTSNNMADTVIMSLNNG